MPRPTTPTIDRTTQLEAALSAWGPLAFDRGAYERFAADWAIEPGATLSRATLDATAFVFAFGADRGDPVQVEQVGDCGLNGSGYLRVAAVGSRALKRGSKVAVIPIMGPVTPFQAPKWYAEFGIRVAALPNIVTAARAAANDPEVGRIVYAVHSPGGSAFGVGEAAAALREVSKTKPTVAAVTYLSASAAYWLSSAQREIVAAPSALIGSVGVRVTHMDVSKALDDMGIRMTELSMPESKSDLSPYKPLSDTARAELMRTVEDIYGVFAADISSARRIDMGKDGEQYGRVHPASHAKSIGMVDRVATFEAILGESAPPADLTATRRARLAILERQVKT